MTRPQLTNVRRQNLASIEQLAAAIDDMDAALSRVKGGRAQALQQLQVEQDQLEEELGNVFERVTSELAASTPDEAPKRPRSAGASRWGRRPWFAWVQCGVAPRTLHAL